MTINANIQNTSNHTTYSSDSHDRTPHPVDRETPAYSRVSSFLSLDLPNPDSINADLIKAFTDFHEPIQSALNEILQTSSTSNRPKETYISENQALILNELRKARAEVKKLNERISHSKDFNKHLLNGIEEDFNTHNIFYKDPTKAIDLLKSSEILKELNDRLKATKSDLKPDLQEKHESLAKKVDAAAEEVNSKALLALTKTLKDVLQVHVDDRKNRSFIKSGNLKKLNPLKLFLFPGSKARRREKTNKALETLLKTANLREQRDDHVSSILREENATPRDKGLIIKGTGETTRSKFIKDGNNNFIPKRNNVTLLYPGANQQSDSRYISATVNSRSEAGWGAFLTHHTKIPAPGRPSPSINDDKLNKIKDSNLEYRKGYTNSFISLKHRFRYDERLQTHRTNSLPQLLLEAFLIIKKDHIMHPNSVNKQGLQGQYDLFTEQPNTPLNEIKAYLRTNTLDLGKTCTPLYALQVSADDRDLSLLNRLEKDDSARDNFNHTMEALKNLSSYEFLTDPS